MAIFAGNLILQGKKLYIDAHTFMHYISKNIEEAKANFVVTKLF